MIPSFRKSSSSLVKFQNETKVPLRALNSFAQGILFRSGAALFQLKAQRWRLNLRVLRGRPRPRLTHWHLVFVGTRDSSKQLLGIIAFDSEL